MNAIWKGCAQARTAVGLAVLLTLAACGGGGGGDDTTVNPSGGPSSAASLSGVASKGLLKRANVKAYGVDAQGKQTSVVLASAVTSDTGNYSLSGLPTDAVVVIEVTPGTNTKMADEATGADIDVPPGFKLRAVKVVGSGAETLQVTPYSEMAVALAESSVGFTRDVVNAANAKVAAAVGLDVLSIEPKFDATNKPLNPVAVSVAAVSVLAKASSVAGCDAASLGVAASAAPVAQAAKVKCVVERLATGGTADNALIAKLEAARRSVEGNGYTGPSVPPLVASADNSLPLAAAALTGVRQAKDLVSSVRTTAVALSDSGSAKSFASRINTVTKAVDEALLPLDGTTLAVLATLELALTALDDPATQLDGLQPQERFEINGVAGALNVTCQLYADKTLTTVATTFASVQSLGCRVTHQVIGPVGINKPFAIQHSIAIVKHSADDYGVGTALVMQTGSIATGRFKSDESTPTPLSGLGAPVYKEMRVQRTPAAGSYNAFAAIGEMAPGVNLERILPIGEKQAVNLGVSSEATSTGLTKLNLVGELRLMEGSTVYSGVSIARGSYVQGKTAVAGLLDDVVDNDTASQQLHLVVETTFYPGAKIKGTLDASDFVRNPQRRGPTKASFIGVVTEADGTELFNGRVDATLPVDPDAGCAGCSAKLEGTLTGTQGTTANNALSLSLSVTRSATVEGEFTFAGRYVPGNALNGAAVFLVNGRALDIPGGGSAEFTISTPSGVGFTYHEGDLTVPITQGNTLLGIFNRKNSRLVFADNSYQQF